MNEHEVRQAARDLSVVLDSFAARSEANRTLVRAIQKAAFNWNQIETLPWFRRLVVKFISR